MEFLLCPAFNMQSMAFSRAAVSGLRGAQQRMGVATLAAFKTPKVANEPNVSTMVITTSLGDRS